MPPNDFKSLGPFSPLCPYSRLSAASRPSSWGSTGSSRWTDEEEEGWTWKKRTRGEEQDEGVWRRKSRERVGECEKVRRMDEELTRLREAPVTVKTVSGPGKFALSIDMNIFRPEDIEVLMSPGRVVVNAEREVSLEQHTSVVRRFRRTIGIPDDVGTDAVAARYFDNNGTSLREAFLQWKVIRAALGAVD